MSGSEAQVCDAHGLDGLIRKLASEIAQGARREIPLCLIGVRTRGVPIAGRIADRLRDDHQLPCQVGALDITLYRDDLGKADHWPVLRQTEIPFPIDGAEVVLVDDVLFTGRTVRAALNGVCDLGRPARVRLAVLVDRGGRELPIRADLVGMTLETAPGGRVLVRVRPVDDSEGIFRVDPSDRP